MCPDREILSAYLDGEIGAPWDRAIAEHVASCDSCRAVYERLAQTRRILQGDAGLEWREPMERVRRGIAANVLPPPRPGAPVWRRSIPIPIPVAFLAAVLLLTLGVTLALSMLRTNIGYVRVTRAPAGGTEYQFAVPVDKVEALLKSVGAGDSRDEVMRLPKDVKLIPVGQPRMGKAAEFPGIKQ
jgi:predicted anti-sigma-YlaC factor YlaD